ncbi:TIGR02302 family protein [Agrobacterium vitis]|nr:TIGR02302 family protein [Agrobacterium vitis]
MTGNRRLPMTASGTKESQGALNSDQKLARRLAVNRWTARLVLFCERLLPLLLLPASIAAIFLSLAWLGFFREAPGYLRWPLVFLLVFAFLASLLPLARLRWPHISEADRLLEERNHLPHQPIGVQGEEPAFDTPFARALWHEHQRRMATRIATLDAGRPKPDIARFDRFGLRALPALLLAVAFAYSGSNGAGRLTDAFLLQDRDDNAPTLRIDAWITPPGYTGRPPVFLTGRNGDGTQDIAIPAQSVVTVRLTGSSGDEQADFKPASGAAAVALQPVKADQANTPGPSPTVSSATPTPAPTDTSARTLTLTLGESGMLDVGNRQWPLKVIPDHAPTIAFDGIPKRAVNGALEIGFTARDDYGLLEARAEIVPVDADPQASPLYPLPEFKLDLPSRNARDIKSISSRNLTEHPLAGKKVRITLIAKDGLGQEGRSPAHEMILPGRNFSEPLAAAVAEQRQVFALDTRQMPRAVALNEALTLRADETIPQLSHYLLISSAHARMQMASTTEALKDTADYLWEIALGIDDGDVSLAERKLSEAQQKLSEALERNAPDAEIKKLMDEVRQAMQDYMKALADRQQPQNGQQNQQSAQKMLTQRDLENMMNQIENLARSGNKDAARQMLQEMQRMMNNLQAGRPQRSNPQQQQQTSEARKQIDKLGQIMQDQQKLMDQTFKLDQELQSRSQMGDDLQPEDGDGMSQDNPPTGPTPDGEQNQDQGQNQNKDSAGKNPSSPDQMTAEQLREALKQLRQQQDALGKQLKGVQDGLGKLGIKPGENFGQAGREMQGAGEALGKSQGDRAVQGQGRALEALRQGARDMMNQMMQALQPGQGQGQGQGQGMAEGNQGGRDPLGRPRSTTGPDFGERVKVPDEIDVQRAREILDAIRNKLGNNASPEVERRYLERLLDM